MDNGSESQAATPSPKTANKKNNKGKDKVIKAAPVAKGRGRPGKAR